jgi:hypothetical protein
MKTMKNTFTMTIGLLTLLAASAMSGSAQERRTNDGPNLGAPHGISYEVIRASQIVRMDAGRCGYHDLSLPNGAVYSIETRVYHEYNQGRIIRTWTENAEVFPRCYEP